MIRGALCIVQYRKSLHIFMFPINAFLLILNIRFTHQYSIRFVESQASNTSPLTTRHWHMTRAHIALGAIEFRELTLLLIAVTLAMCHQAHEALLGLGMFSLLLKGTCRLDINIGAKCTPLAPTGERTQCPGGSSRRRRQ